MKIFIFSLIFFCLSSSVALANTSFKKGAGQDYHYPMILCNTTDVNNTCVVNYMNKVKSLGVSWLYLWGFPNPAWLDSSIEFVPMIFAHGTNADSSYPQGMLDWYKNWTSQNPGSHWLIWNEPDLYISWLPDPHSEIPPQVAARIYKPLYDAIKLGDSTAKVIVGGLYDINLSSNSWITTFRNEYKRLNGDFPPVDGWAFHYYKTYSLNGFRDTINSVKSWYANNGYSGKEFWLTEFGNLSSNEAGLQMLKDQQEWLETEPFVTRYAFFYTGVEGNQKGNLLTGSTNNLGAAQLSPLGIEYAKHPLNAPTPSPTSSICGSVAGSACCTTHTCQSSSGLYCFNETCNKVADKNSSLAEWSAAFNVFNQSLDFNNDNIINGVDYVFWLREGKSL